MPAAWYTLAKQKGYKLLGRGARKSDVTLHCPRCAQTFQVRSSVLVNNAPECKHCLWQGRLADAMATGATILAPDPNNHKLVHLQLPCGHIACRQYSRLATAAQGGHRLGCEECREETYRAQARAIGWTLVGPATDNTGGYRRYAHSCGHQQDVAIVNVDKNQLDCAGCGESWVSKPSQIYLFRIELVDRPVLKLGHSSDPERRLFQQLGPAARDTGEVLRAIDMKTGHAALVAEKRAHRTMRTEHPGWVVPREVFAGQINTKSEIYEIEALEFLLSLMDEIEAEAGEEKAANPKEPDPEPE
ncbi:hypothetical protein [Thalassorhabdomicrobium marinisediminis]|uniref:hypothetical protein n=1 Tax=Thalassorhabdomicrobium marinisediminis TaxID=2170577 RepID=UPI0024922B53|nr:hypothetical protein [Thalassorhabdomicrobium marinisediminis]